VRAGVCKKHGAMVKGNEVGEEAIGEEEIAVEDLPAPDMIEVPIIPEVPMDPEDTAQV